MKLKFSLFVLSFLFIFRCNLFAQGLEGVSYAQVTVFCPAQTENPFGLNLFPAGGIFPKISSRGYGGKIMYTQRISEGLSFYVSASYISFTPTGKEYRNSGAFEQNINSNQGPKDGANETSSYTDENIINNEAFDESIYTQEGFDETENTDTTSVISGSEVANLLGTYSENENLTNPPSIAFFTETNSIVTTTATSTSTTAESGGVEGTTESALTGDSQTSTTGQGDQPLIIMPPPPIEIPPPPPIIPPELPPSPPPPPPPPGDITHSSKAEGEIEETLEETIDILKKEKGSLEVSSLMVGINTRITQIWNADFGIKMGIGGSYLNSESISLAVPTAEAGFYIQMIKGIYCEAESSFFLFKEYKGRTLENSFQAGIRIDILELLR